MFVNRETELDYLEQLNKKKDPRLIIVYGRRRIGKTELLRQFSKGKKHLFFTSDLSSEQEQLRQFTDKVFQLSGDSFLQQQQFSSWDAALRYIFNHIDKTPLIIIDEFPYLCISNKALPSILQKIWDEETRNSKNIFLVLCGSYMSFMEKEILGSKSPLFGRRTGQIALQPLKFADMKNFFPLYAQQDLVRVYSVLGGTPAYLIRFNGKKSIESNIKNEILDKNSFLYSETRFLLMEELREPSVYFSVLKSIAFGKTRLNEIVQDTGLKDSQKVNKYISILRDLRIVRREVPATEDKPYKSRKGIYLIQDPFFRFWFRFVYPNLSYLEEDDIDFVWKEKIKPNFESFTSFVFEDICVQKIKRLNSENKLPFKAKSIGRWWDKEGEIDAVALGEKGAFLFCEKKWTKKKLGVKELIDLQRKAGKFPQASKAYFGFFSKAGFTQEMVDTAKNNKEVLLFDYLS